MTRDDSTGIESVDPSDFDLIEQACDQFEAALRVGKTPRIEAYLALVDGSKRGALFPELLALELDWQRFGGEDSSLDVYEQRFPDRITTVRDVFARMRNTPVAAPPDESDLDNEDSPYSGTARPRGRFRILRILDSGGTGDVFVALDEQIGREVALKQLQARFAHEPRSRERFEFEARITGLLEHPGVLPIYAVAHRTSGVPYYVSKLIHGETLATAIEQFQEKHHPWTGRDPQAHLELKRLLARFLTVCHTIAYAHNRGVIHRDLKPDNILLGEHGETLVVDWGLARLRGSTPPIDGHVTLLFARAGGRPGTVAGRRAGLRLARAALRSGQSIPATAPRGVAGTGSALAGRTGNRPDHVPVV